VVVAAVAWRRTEPLPSAPVRDDQRQIREALFREIKTVALSNCTLKRFGSVNDGGYLLCENLIPGLEAAYSYGIGTEDNWGCEVSKLFGVAVHQYDCFTKIRPACPGGRSVYHNECIAGRTKIEDSHPFDTLANQLAKNGHAGKRVLVKIDVEGSEWESLLATPDAVLERIDQLPIELHGSGERRFIETIQRLKRTFYLVSVHFNNWSCDPMVAPFPARAFQVLFVNKRLGVLDPSRRPHKSGTQPDAPDNPEDKDCQIQP
jgi:hypothetical protein